MPRTTRPAHPAPLRLSRRALFAALALTAAAVCGAGAAHAAPAGTGIAPSEARRYVEDFTRSGLATFNDPKLDKEAKRNRMREAIRDGFAIDEISRFVLGRHYRSLSDDQKTKYHSLYFDYVLATYFKQLINLQELRLNFLETVVAPDGDALVSTEALRKNGPPVRLQWRVTRTDGKLRIVDIIAEGVSLAVTQRSDFNAVMGQQGFDGLVQALQNKIQQADRG